MKIDPFLRYQNLVLPNEITPSVWEQGHFSIDDFFCRDRDRGVLQFTLKLTRKD